MTDENTAFAEAQAAEILRQQIGQYAANAVHYANVDRDWVNARLNRMGAPLVTGTAQYKIHAPIDAVYGTTITANSRVEALAKFQEFFGQVVAAGEFRRSNHGAGVFQITATGGKPVFFSGPEDVEPSDAEAPALEPLRAAIRQMLMDAVTTQGWGYSYAVSAAQDMGLEALPTLHTKTVTVPVTGTTQVGVLVFSDADDDTVQAAAQAMVSRTGYVSVTPEEIGEATWARPDAGMSLTMVDEVVDKDEDTDDTF
jgi:hypothetical protein